MGPFLGDQLTQGFCAWRRKEREDRGTADFILCFGGCYPNWHLATSVRSGDPILDTINVRWDDEWGVRGEIVKARGRTVAEETHNTQETSARYNKPTPT